MLTSESQFAGLDDEDRVHVARPRLALTVDEDAEDPPPLVLAVVELVADAPVGSRGREGSHVSGVAAVLQPKGVPKSHLAPLGGRIRGSLAAESTDHSGFFYAR